ncbi:MAG TPA: YfhO family protein, partial [Thermoanaerobaculia bacterium]|nr:YfhO family protein [Thermoanaerobaculia bacterium]
FCLTGRAVFTGGVYGPIDLAYIAEPFASIADKVGVTRVVNPGVSDVFAQFLPWNAALRHAISDGDWPLWNPYELSGGPLAGAAQSAPYHPLTLLALLLPMADGVTFSATLLFFIAALSMFLLTYAIVRRELPSLFAAAAFMLSTHMVWFAGTAHALAISVAPLVLLGARNVARSPGPRSASLLGGALLLLVLAGHPESALHIVALAVAYFLFELFGVRREVSLRRVLVSGAGAGIAALLLSAMFLLPMLTAIPQTREALHREKTYTGRVKASTPAQLIHRTRASFLPMLEGMPGLEEEEHAADVKHGWLATAYAGSMLFPAALFALFRSPRREKWFFAGVFVWGVAAAVSAPGLVHLLARLPGFEMAVNDRMVYFAVIALALLAALGIDVGAAGASPAGLSSAGEGARRSNGLSIIYGVTAIVIGVIALTAHTALAHDFILVATTRAVLPLLLAAAALLVWRAPRTSLALFALLLIQRTGDDVDVQATVRRAAFYPKFPGLELMRANEPFRVVGVGATLIPGTAAHYALEDVRGYQAMTFGRYFETYPLWCVEQPVWSNRVDDLSRPFLSMMNVRFAVAPASYTPPEGWSRIGGYDAYAILLNHRVLPRAFIPRSVHLGAFGVRDMMNARDFGEESWIVTNDPYLTKANGAGRISAIREQGARLSFHASMQSEGWIVISNAAWKAWRAESDGRRLPIRFANHAFIGIQLPPGEHDVALIYRPRMFVAGAAISGATALALGVAFVSMRKRQRQN